LERVKVTFGHILALSPEHSRDFFFFEELFELEIKSSQTVPLKVNTTPLQCNNGEFLLLKEKE
jgi:hypothetical protein